MFPVRDKKRLLNKQVNRIQHRGEAVLRKNLRRRLRTFEETPQKMGDKAMSPM